MNYSEKSENFLQVVLDCFVDGILVLTAQQAMIYANATADAICSQLPKDNTRSLPRELQRVCDALVDSSTLYPDRPITIESEITTTETTFRVRAQWLCLDTIEQPCILLRLQDQNKSVQSLATAEAQRWNLTAREAEVWQLRRSGLTRKEIASELYIALDTVKKHLKNIQFKRQASLDEEEWQANQAS